MRGRVRIEKFRGEQTSGSATLAAESPDGWSTSHVLTGCTYVYIRLEYDQERMPGLQSIEAEVVGKNDIYDPRSGGTGFTSNWALCVLDYLRHPDGLACTNDELDLGSFSAAANLSDEAVQIAADGTTQSRFTCDGAFKLDRSPMDIMEAMLSAGGALVYVQGQYRLHGWAYSAPTANIGPGDMAGEMEIVPRAARRDLFNGVRGTFIDPSRGFQAAEFGAVFNPAYDTQDGGDRIWKDVEFPFTTNNIRAQRLAFTILQRARQSLHVKVPLKYAALRLCVWQTVALTQPDLGLDAKPMRVVDWDYDPKTGGVIVDLQAEAANSYSWVYEDAYTAPSPPDTTLINPLQMPTPSAPYLAASAALQSDGAIIPSIAVTWAPVLHAFVTGMEVWWRTAGGGWQQVLVPVSDGRTDLFPLIGGATYEVMLRAVTNFARSAFSPTSTIVAAADTTLPGVPSGLTATPTIGGVVLTWNPVGDDDLDRYQVFERPDALSAYTLIADVYATKFNRPVPSGVTRRWSVRSVDRSGNASNRSVEVVAGQGQVATSDMGAGGGNLIWNSCCSADTVGWEIEGFVGASSALLYSCISADTAYYLTGLGTGALRLPGAVTAGGYAAVHWGTFAGFPVVPSQRYQMSALLQAHGCQGWVNLAFFDGAGTYISETAGNAVSLTSAHGATEDTYALSTVLETAPAGAATVRPRIVLYCPAAATSPVVLFTKTFWGRAPDYASQPAIWAPGGTLQVSGGQIVPATVGTPQVASDAITTHVSATAISTVTGTGSEIIALSMTFSLAEARTGTLLVALQHGYALPAAHAVAVYVDGAVIFSRIGTAVNDYPTFMEPLSLGAGTHVIQLGWTGDAGNINLDRRSMVAFLRAR